VLLVASRNIRAAYEMFWTAAWGLPLLVAVGAAWLLVSKRAEPASDARRTVVVVLACVALTLLLVEFPFATPAYTLFHWPVAMLAAIGIARSQSDEQPASRALLGVVVGCFVLFGVLRLQPASMLTLGRQFERNPNVTPLTVERGGLNVAMQDAGSVADLVDRVQTLAPGRRLWAGPDAAEVYFLAGQPNRTRALFDFLATDSTATWSVARRAIATGATLVVVKHDPEFSGKPTDEDFTAFRAAYLYQSRMPGFTIFWR
jgi:hypothetical protein